MFEALPFVKSPILDRNLLNYRDWMVGAAFTPTFPLEPVGPRYYPDSHHNQMALLPGAINGRLSPIVKSVVSDTINNVHGGLVSSVIPVDENKTYRMSVWIHVSNLTITGLHYSGLHFGFEVFNKLPTSKADGIIAATMVKGGSGASSTHNPYFLVVSYEQIPNSEWLLCVGYVLGKNESDLSIADGMGLYKVDGTHLGYDYFADKIFANQSTTIPAYRNTYQWQTGSLYASFRIFNSVPLTMNDEMQYAYPRLDVVDGSEPTIQQLIQGWDLSMMRRR